MAVTRIWDADNGEWLLVGGTLPVAGGGGGGGDFLPLTGGTMSGPLVLASDPSTAMQAAPKQYVDTFLPLAGGTMTGALTLSGPPTSALHAATKDYVDTVGIAWTRITGKPASYPLADAWTTARTLTLTGDVTGSASIKGNANVSLSTAVVSDSHTHDTRYYTEGEVNSLLSGKANNHSHPYIDEGGTQTQSGTLYTNTLFANGLGPGAMWAYHGGSNGSIRWMGVGVGLSQNHTSSSDEYKDTVEAIDLSKSVFARLTPIWFTYKTDHPFKERWTDDSFERYENPESIGRMGFSYEEMEELAPHWTYEADGMKAIGYDALLPDFAAWAVAAIRSLQNRIAELEGAAV
jgi:hypothetical protein